MNPQPNIPPPKPSFSSLPYVSVFAQAAPLIILSANYFVFWLPVSPSHRLIPKSPNHFVLPGNLTVRRKAISPEPSLHTLAKPQKFTASYGLVEACNGL